MSPSLRLRLLPGGARSRALPWLLLGALLAALLGALLAVWAWDLGGHGLASHNEVPAAQRAQAWSVDGSLGQLWGLSPSTGIAGLGLRLTGLAAASSDAGHALLRAPQLFCALALVVLAFGWAFGRGQREPQASSSAPWSPGLSEGLSRAAVLAALPVIGTAARQLQPQLWAELALTLWCFTLRRPRQNAIAQRLIQATATLLLLNFAGMGWGLSTAFALAWLDSGRRGWGIAALACVGASVAITHLADPHAAWVQRLMAASPTLASGLEAPQPYFTGAVMNWVSDYGLWTPLLAYAFVAADPKLRFERCWLGLVCLGQLLSFPHWGTGPLMAVIPAATLLVSAAQRLRSWRGKAQLLIWLVLGSGLLLSALAQDPQALAWPHQIAEGISPERSADLSEILRLWRLEAGLLALIVLSFWLSSPRLKPARSVIQLVALGLMITLRSQLGADALAKQSSVRAVAELARSGLGNTAILAGQIASQGVEDPGWSFYAHPQWRRLATAQQGLEQLKRAEPAILVLSRDSDLNLSGALARLESPLQFQDAGHPILRVLSNRGNPDFPYLPQAALVSEIPELEHRCKVVFDDALELLGWSLCDKPSPGRPCTFKAAFRVLKAQSGARSLVAQVRQPPWSAWPAFGTPTLDARFPISQWRPGDLVVVHQDWEIPWLMSKTGESELSIGLARSRYRWVPISYPRSDPPEQPGLRWLGRKRRRIVLGKVQIH